MLLGKSHHLFDRAEQAYDRAIHLIRTLTSPSSPPPSGTTRRSAMTPGSPLYQFDVILQAILLRMALIRRGFPPAGAAAHRQDHPLRGFAGLPEEGDRWEP